MMVERITCPACSNNTFAQAFSCEDYTVSHETFEIKKCLCGLKLTLPRPDDSLLERYYQSDNYISHTGKGDSLINHIYLAIRNFSIKWKASVVSHYSKKSSHIKLLDYGCGTGEFIRYCKSIGFEVNGLEPSQSAREKAAKLNDIQIFASTPQVKATYDAITLWHVLEHIPDIDTALNNIAKNLNQDGTLFIAVPNYESFDATYYKQYWAAYDVPRHLWHFNKESMKKLLSRFGLKIEEIKPMKLDAFYVSMLSEQYKSGKKNILNLIKAFYIGLISNLKARKTGNYSSLIYIIKK